MVENCLFCKIINGEVPSKKVYEDDEIYAFHDIEPAASTHILIIPKKHIPSVSQMKEEDIILIGKLIYTATKLAKQENIEKSGYRLVINNGPDAGMAVDHLHLHLIGGRKMNWPPG
jgi:histidine triad (HIT) family protein